MPQNLKMGRGVIRRDTGSKKSAANLLWIYRELLIMQRPNLPCVTHAMMNQEPWFPISITLSISLVQQTITEKGELEHTSTGPQIFGTQTEGEEMIHGFHVLHVITRTVKTIKAVLPFP